MAAVPAALPLTRATGSHPARSTDQRWREGVLIAQVFVATRLLLLGTALVVAIRTKGSVSGVLDNWDVAHFSAIARNGYAVATDVAFFPGLPFLLRPGLALGIAPEISGVGLSLVTSALAVWALYRLGGKWASIAWLLAPTAVFTLVAYSESPFCAAAFWAWERATKRQWWSAALLAAGACTLRVSGLFLIGALGVLALTQAWDAYRARLGEASGVSAAVDRASGSTLTGAGPGERAARALLVSVPWLLIPAAVLFSYAAYLYLQTGSWTTWFSAQAAGWMRGFTWPWDCLAHHWAAIQPGMYADHPGWVWVFRAELVSWLVGIVVTVIALRRRKVAEASWVAVQVLAFSLSYWLQSVCRAVLLWFPLWTQIGAFVDAHRTRGWRVVWALVVAVALVVQVTWGVLFYLEMWSS